MEIILLERIAKLGQMGDVVRVRDGFARNFLLPKGKALRANKANMERFEKERVQLEARNLERKTEAEAVLAKLAGQSYIAIRTAGDSGQLYGSVSTRDISELVTGGGFSINRTQVLLNAPIKTLGIHAVKIALHPEVETEIKINIARTVDEAERQARGEDITRPASEAEEAAIAAEALFEHDEDAIAAAGDEGEEAAEQN